jgi:hypothetical protein
MSWVAYVIGVNIQNVGDRTLRYILQHATGPLLPPSGAKVPRV